MKKITIITAVLALTLSGCGNAKPAETEDIFLTEAPTQVTEAAETTAAAEEATLPVTEPTEAETQPAETEAVTEPTEPEGESGTVTSRSLNVREGPSISALKVGALKQGDVVTVFETQTVNGMFWGRIDSGWISMDYIRLGGEPIRQQAPDASQPAATEENNWQEPQTPADPVLPEQNEKPDPIPKPTENQTPPEQTDPAPPQISEEPAPTQPKACQHHWSAVANIPAEYEYSHYVVCVCGTRFPDAAAWQAHSNSYSGEELLSHTGYASGSDKTEVSPAKVTWKCDHCGITKTISAWDNP